MLLNQDRLSLDDRVVYYGLNHVPSNHIFSSSSDGETTSSASSFNEDITSSVRYSGGDASSYRRSFSCSSASSSGQEFRLVFLLWSGLDRVLPLSTESSLLSPQSKKAGVQYFINSRLVSVTAAHKGQGNYLAGNKGQGKYPAVHRGQVDSLADHKAQGNYLEQPLRITLAHRHRGELSSLAQPQCAVWDIRSLAWIESGCTLIQVEITTGCTLS